MYTFKDNLTPNHTICEKCFYRYLWGYPFQEKFTTIHLPEGKQWRCDVGRSNTIQVILIEGQSDPVGLDQVYTKTVNLSCNLAPCPGPGQKVTSSSGRVAMQAMTDGTSGLICMACYIDKVLLTTLQNSFRQIELESGSYGCDLAAGATTALRAAIKASNLAILQDSLLAYSRSPSCAGQKGILESEVKGVWHVAIGMPNIEICPACYYSLVVPVGAVHLFSPVEAKHPEAVKTCSFNMGSGISLSYQTRSTILCAVLVAGWKAGDAGFSLYHKYASVYNCCGPPCGAKLRSFTKPSGRKWFGRLYLRTEDPIDCGIMMCEECFIVKVKENFFGSYCSEITDEVYSVPNASYSCQTWSNKSTAVLKEMQDKHDFPQFARYWNQRRQLLAKYQKDIDDCRSIFQTQNMMKANADTHAAIMRSIDASTLGGPTASYGNSAIGFGYGSASSAGAAMQAYNTSWGDITWLQRARQLEAEMSAIE